MIDTTILERTAGDAVDTAILFRRPIAKDGPAVTRLIEACPPLDANSAYCNLLQCTHFPDTCVVAERCGQLVGWVSGYRPPDAPHRIFIWQVAVEKGVRGLGLASAMIASLLDRPSLRSASELITTITRGNRASWTLFRSVAHSHGAALRHRAYFDQDMHFDGKHDTEYLVSIAPLTPNGSMHGMRKETE